MLNKFPFYSILCAIVCHLGTTIGQQMRYQCTQWIEIERYLYNKHTYVYFCDLFAYTFLRLEAEMEVYIDLEILVGRGIFDFHETIEKFVEVIFFFGLWFFENIFFDETKTENFIKNFFFRVNSALCWQNNISFL